MPHVPLVLTEVQRLFRAFETERLPATQLAYLSDALEWLADVAAEEPSPAFQRQCAQMATAYARYIQRKVQPLLRHTRPVDAEVEVHWIQVCNVFENSGFPLPADVKQSFEALRTQPLERVIDRMSPA